MSDASEVEQLKQLGFKLHRRLVEGDLIVTAEIAETFMERTARRLQQRFSILDDPHLIEEAVIEAIVNYFERPAQYDPAKRSLAGYFYMSARGDLLNLLKREKREAYHLVLTEIVELDDSGSEHGVEIQDDFDVEAWVLNQNSPIWQQIIRLLPDPFDQEIVLLMMDGVRETRAYADVLGILDLSNDEQATIVKRHKDRLKKKLQRNIRRAELCEDD